jgi:RHS repeat-associated protein
VTYNSKLWDLETFPQEKYVPNKRSNAGLGWRLSLGRLLAPTDTTLNGNSTGYVYEGPTGDEHPFSNPFPPGNAETDPVQIADQLRLVRISGTIREVQFPSGEVHRFELEHSLWRLKQVKDRYTGHVDITYTYASTSSPRETSWTVTDSTGRTHYVYMGNYSSMAGGWNRGATVSSLSLQAFGGVFATYSFTYSVPVGNTTCLPLLTAISLPDGTLYAFEYSGTGCTQVGPMTKITYPTGGSVAYTWGANTFMANGEADWRAAVCAPVSGDNAVRSRTIADGTTTRTWEYVQQLGPAVPVSFTGSDPCQTMQSQPPPPPGPVYWSRTSVLSPVDSSNKRVRADHYFSVFSGNFDGVAVSPLPGMGYDTYGLPGTIGIPPAGTAAQAVVPGGAASGSWPADIDGSDGTSVRRLLTTQVYAGCSAAGDCSSGQLQRTTFEHYDGRIRNAQLLSTRVRYDDDGGCGGLCYTQSTVSDNNGIDQFRTTLLESNFPGALSVTKTTQYPAWSVSDLLNTTRSWTLQTYTESLRTEGNTTARERFCFDATTGFLRRHAILAGQTLGASDLLTVTEPDSHGDPEYVLSYGGDLQSLGDASALSTGNANLCSLPLPSAAAFKIRQQFTNGIPRTSQYYDTTTGTAMPFYTFDRTIDPWTGVVTADRDTTANYGKSYTYTPVPARLQTMTLPTGATTTYTYTNATGSAPGSFTPARVDTSTPTSSSGTLRSRFLFDGLGRVQRQGTLGPQGNWLATETSFDELGRVAWKSQPESTGTNAPSGPLTAAKKTTYVYDAFGRVTRVTAPDTSVTTFTHKGIRERRKVASVGTGVGVVPVTTLNAYDQNGRLIAVTEDEQGFGLTTNYTYDVGDRLSSMLTSFGGVPQTRTFAYDRRGLLLSETHPELGVNGYGTTYHSMFDARGHAHRQVTGSVDITTDYDPAERPTMVKTTAGQTLKQFLYDDFSATGTSVFPQCVGGKCKGRLVAASRVNYAPSLETVTVTEGYQYNGLGGMLSRRDRTISSPSIPGRSFFFGQTYNDLGMIDTIFYPCRDSLGGCASGDRTPPAVTSSYTNGVLTSVGPWATSISYSPTGAIDTVVHGSGSSAVSEIWLPDPNGLSRPSQIQAKDAAGNVLWSTGQYLYDPSGNITAIGSMTYQYDVFNQLTAWTSNGADGAYSTTIRGYDGAGNYTMSMGKGCGPVTIQPRPCYTTSVFGLTMVGTSNHYTDLTYDDLGDVVVQGPRTFTYDSLGVQTRASVDGRQFRYVYTPDDERIAEVESTATGSRITWSIRDFENRLLSSWLEDTTSGSPVITWKEDLIWRNHSLVAGITPQGTKHYILDHLGSPRLVTNGSGQPLGIQNFDPFGYGGTTDGGTVQFAGMERDSTAIGAPFADLPDYVHQRYFDLNRARFLSPDPVLGSIQLPRSWNRYNYAMLNPLRYTDPAGLATSYGQDDFARLDEEVAKTEQHKKESQEQNNGNAHWFAIVWKDQNGNWKHEGIYLIDTKTGEVLQVWEHNIGWAKPKEAIPWAASLAFEQNWVPVSAKDLGALSWLGFSPRAQLVDGMENYFLSRKCQCSDYVWYQLHPTWLGIAKILGPARVSTGMPDHGIGEDGFKKAKDVLPAKFQP